MKSRVFIGVVIVAFAAAAVFGWRHFSSTAETVATAVVAETSKAAAGDETAW